MWWSQEAEKEGIKERQGKDKGEEKEEMDMHA